MTGGNLAWRVAKLNPYRGGQFTHPGHTLRLRELGQSSLIVDATA